MNSEQLYQLYKAKYLIDTDTRRIRQGSIFFALKGENFDGNIFAKKAIELGASYAVIDDEKYLSKHTILVKDVLKTLQKLANFHRKELGIPIISITGSNGKTTTKELVNAILSKKYNTVATKGNLNNHIGVPLTLLSMTPKTEIGIVEMGANHLKEIKILCGIAQPNYGYITNFGKAHLEGFGGFEGVVKGKTELYQFLKKTNGKCFVNTFDELQLKTSQGCTQIPFLETIQLGEITPFLSLFYNKINIKSHLIGNYNYNNIVAAITIGNYFKVRENDIKEAVEEYIPSNNRSQIVKKGTTRIILDAYNANPTSMQAALENINNLSNGKKVLFLGDMFELGKQSDIEHQKIYDLASNFYHFSNIILIGTHFSKVKIKENTLCFHNFEELKASFSKINLKNSTVLIKASRGMALERIVALVTG